VDNLSEDSFYCSGITAGKRIYSGLERILINIKKILQGISGRVKEKINLMSAQEKRSKV